MNKWNEKQHSYEEIRQCMVDLLLEPLAGNTGTPGRDYNVLPSAIAERFLRRENRYPLQYGHHPELHPSDEELVRDVFWDLFRQGFITPGLNSNNPNFPWFRLSHFAQNTLHKQSPYRFHDTSSYIAMVKENVPDLLPETEVYLEEAVATFYADCVFASCVVLGVAAEIEFCRLIDICSANANHGIQFKKAKNEFNVRQKIKQFQSAVNPLLANLSPKANFEEVDTNLSFIQSVLRIARNNAGHAKTSAPQREQVYIWLQLFVPFALQVKHLRTALA